MKYRVEMSSKYSVTVEVTVPDGTAPETVEDFVERAAYDLAPKELCPRCSGPFLIAQDGEVGTWGASVGVLAIEGEVIRL